MTNQQTIYLLNNLRAFAEEDDNPAIDMAIEALYKPTSDDLIIKGAKGIKDGLYNIQNGELFQYKAKGGTVRAYQIVEAPQDDWIPVSERLPEEMEYVLVTDGIEVWEDRIEKVNRTDTYRWDQCMASVYLHEDWHWRPFPEPYRESEDE